MSKLQVHVTTEETGNKNVLSGVLATLVVLIIIGLVGWGVLELIQAVLPTIGLLGLGMWGAWELHQLKNRKRSIAELDKAGQPMSLRNMWYTKIILKRKKADTKPLTEEQITKQVQKELVALAIVYLAAVVTQLVLLLAHATNETYQQVMVVNVLGAALIINTVVFLVKLLPGMVKTFGEIDTPLKDQTWPSFIWTKFVSLATLIYIVAIFLMVFGII